MSATRQFGSGGTGLAPCSLHRNVDKRALRLQTRAQWRWHLDEVFMKSDGEHHYPWLVVNRDGEALEVLASRRRDREAAKVLLKRAMKRYGRPQSIVTNHLPTCGAAMKDIGNASRKKQVAGLITELKTPNSRSDAQNRPWPVSEVRQRTRNSPLSTPPCTTVFTSNVPSTSVVTSRSIGLPRWPNGGNLPPESIGPWVTYAAQSCSDNTGGEPQICDVSFMDALGTEAFLGHGSRARGGSDGGPCDL